MGKTVKVRNQDYGIYSEKLDEAIELLLKEWEVISTNSNIDIFIEKSKTFHLLSNNLKSFSYREFLKSVYLSQYVKPEDPKEQELLSVPEKPVKDDLKYLFSLKWYHKLFYLFFYSTIKESRAKYENDINRYNETLHRNKKIEETNRKNKETYLSNLKTYEDNIIREKDEINSFNNELEALAEGYKKSKKDDVIDYFNRFLYIRIKEYNHIYSKITIETDYHIEDKTLIVNFNFPKENQFPKFRNYKFVKTHKIIQNIEFKKAEREELIKEAYYSLYIAILNDIIKVDTAKIATYIILNGIYQGLDSRTGKEFEACIMTAKVQAEDFKTINLSRIKTKDTFKFFSGKGVPDPNNISPVEPIRFIDKGKFKLIDSGEVLSNLSIDTNLAAMDWRDFETLIKDLFELEFRDQEIEIRNTQHTNDGGIDVVAFNNNPYTGGIILLQAKRYTNTVQPEPVRALKGSMEQHNAIRGILATTSRFGASSIEYARQHNITLIDGDKLLEMFKKHNYNFHIDLEQAKKNNAMN